MIICWTRYTEETKPVFNKVQWSENDHEMIRSFAANPTRKGQ